MPKKLDFSQLAHALVENTTGEAIRPKNPAAVALGRLGGQKGGPARAKKLTAVERSEIAKKAADARWANSNSETADEAAKKLNVNPEVLKRAIEAAKNKAGSSST